MNPILILPPDVMSEEHMEALRQNGICTVVAKDPEAVKFLDPLPAQSSRTEIENAAIQLSRKLLNRQWAHISNTTEINSAVITKLFVECLVKGTPLDSAPTLVEQEISLFSSAKRSEIERIAREEARTEAAAKKASKTTVKK